MKGTTDAKSRLGASAALARAVALDTVAAALASVPSVPEPVDGVEGVDVVARVIVVTSPAASADFAALGATVVEDPGAGLNAAARAGIAAAGTNSVAVLLGDVPALAAGELALALRLAGEHPLSMVADADGDGTVLIAARDASDHRPIFGAGSRAAHVAAGYIELDIPHDSGLRRDVDTPEQLAFLASSGRLGFRTTAATS